MEAYPTYRCPNCGGHTNMMGTGHVDAKRFGVWLCEKAPTRGLLEPTHYDLGPTLSVDWDSRKKSFAKRERVEGSIVTTPLSELEAYRLAATRLPELQAQTEARRALLARLEAEEVEKASTRESQAGRLRPSALAEA